jgi:hypothetical protein
MIIQFTIEHADRTEILAIQPQFPRTKTPVIG